MNTLIIRNGLIAESMERADIVVEDGSIAQIAPGVSGVVGEEINASGLVIFPGFVDAHVHFNEPGRGHWEGLETGPRALAAGGSTVFCDMPLNSDPPVLDAESLQTKRRIAEEKSVADFALWGGLCPGHLDQIPRMAEAGAMGFKAFMCPSGLDEFPHSDAATLREGMRLARVAGLPVAVHAEDAAVVEAASVGISGRSLRDFFATRPKAAEVSAIRLACELAGETGVALQVVHVTCREGLEVIAAAKKAGVDVTAETCPHYLMFDAESAISIGALAKCAPPIRSREDVAALWASLDEGFIDTIGSDHSPAPPDMKTGDDFFAIWGGIAGCQHGALAFLGEYIRRHPDGFAKAASWLAARPAERFRLSGKGRLQAGFDADLAMVAFGDEREPAPAFYRHPAHPYQHIRPRCAVRHVLRRGEFLVRDASLIAPASRGKFLHPTN